MKREKGKKEKKRKKKIIHRPVRHAGIPLRLSSRVVYPHLARLVEFIVAAGIPDARDRVA